MHHECPCRIGKYYPRDRNLPGTRLAESLVDILTPRARFTYMVWLMMDYFSPTSSEFQTSNQN